MELNRCKTAAEEEEEEERDNRGKWLSSAPAEILVEILMRLPHCKQAFQFKLVSKRWNSILSDPYFFHRAAAFHRHRLSDSTFSFTLVFQLSTNATKSTTPARVLALKVPKPQANGHVRRLNLDRLIALGGPGQSPCSPSRSRLNIAASCNDLLLLEEEHQSCYYVVNVQTHHWIALPPSPPREELANGTAISFKAGLLCHSDLDCFKVIRILYVSTTTLEIAQTLPIPGLDRPELTVHIYSSDSNTWSRYAADWYPFRLTHYLTTTPIVSHNAMFHWVNGRALLSLDPFRLNFDRHYQHHRLTLTRTLQLPVTKFLDDPEIGLFHDFCHGKISKFLGIGVVRHHIRIVTLQIDGQSDGGHSRLLVWQLDADADAHGPWSLVHNVLMSEFPLKRILNKFDFLACHPYEPDVLLVQILNSVYQLNLHTHKLRKPTGKPIQGSCSLRNVPPPLVHQWFPTPLTLLPPNCPL